MKTFPDNNLLLAMAVALLLAACQETELADEQSADKAVVNAIIHPGSDFRITLSRLIPFNTDDETDTVYTLSALSVLLHINGAVHQLVESSDTVGQYVLPDGVSVLENDQLELHFAYNNLEVSASSTVPSKPTNPYLSATSYTPVFGMPGQESDPLTVFWDNADGSHYLIICEYMGTSFTMINDFPGDEEPTQEELEAMLITSSQPITTDSYDFRMFRFTGSHRVIIYHLSEEYVSLIQSGGQSSITISTPYTNLTNGLGIFTSVNSDTLWLQITS